MDKKCKRCGETKPLDAFYAQKGCRDGRRPECKSCTSERRKNWYQQNREREIARVKAWQQQNAARINAYHRSQRERPEVKARERDGHLRRKFGITIEQYDAMFEEQGGVCFICRRPPTEGISLHVDHYHATGRNRGLLCFRCNNALGDLDDDPDLLRTAADYLDAHDPEVEELAELTHLRLAALRA